MGRRDDQGATIQFTTPWNVFTPRLFRYLKSEHVEAFWADGSLRRSSFAQIATHADEQRHDANEGSANVICRTEAGGRADHRRMHKAPGGTTTYDEDLLLGTIAGAADHVPLFLKEERFADQAEYRLLWFTDGVVPPYLSIKAPDARQFC